MKKLLGIVVLGLLWCVPSLSESSLPNCKGSDHSKWKNCYGEYKNLKLTNVWSRNFKGEFGSIPGLRSGSGFSEVLKNGKLVLTCEGDFANDVRVGFSECKDIHGMVNIQLDIEGEAGGIAKKIYPDGDIYIGEVDKNGNRDGKGLLRSVNGKHIIGTFKKDHYIGNVPMDQIQEFEEGVLIIESKLKARSKCKNSGISLLSDQFSKCTNRLFKIYLEELNNERLIQIAAYKISSKTKKTLWKSEDGKLSECVSYTVSGACAKLIPYVKKKKKKKYSSSSYSSSKPKLYYDPSTGGMRECFHDPGVTGKCMAFKNYNPSLYNKDTLFYNANSGAMQPCIGLVTPLGKCTAFGLYTHGTVSKNQLFYNPKKNMMSTCVHVNPATGTCLHYDLVPRNYGNEGGFRIDNPNNPYMKNIPRSSRDLLELSNRLMSGCTLGINC